MTVSLPAPEAFVAALGPAVRQAAAIARALEGRVANRPKHGEARAAKAALTLADTAAQEAILVPLFERFPYVRVEAEEETEGARRFPARSDACVVVDPIDGTLHSYLEGRGPYAVMVGLALEERFEAALVALPREGLFFEAVRGHGARSARAGGPLREARLHTGGDRVIVSHEMPETVQQRLREGGWEVVFGCGGAISIAPLIPGVRAGLRLAPAGGSISRRGRIGALIAAEAGAVLRGADGAPFPEDLAAHARALLVARSASDAETLSKALGDLDAA